MLSGIELKPEISAETYNAANALCNYLIDKGNTYLAKSHCIETFINTTGSEKVCPVALDLLMNQYLTEKQKMEEAREQVNCCGMFWMTKKGMAVYSARNRMDNYSHWYHALRQASEAHNIQRMTLSSK